MTGQNVWGVDLGGTKVGIGTQDVYREEATAPTARGIVDQIVAATPPGAALGLCVAGRINTRDGTTLAAQLPQLAGFPLVAALEQTGRSSLLVNDADAAALAEYELGAGRGSTTMLYVTVSTGIGGGLVSDGRLYQGANGQALEVGHAGGGQAGLPCPCGRTGCIDTVASGRVLLQRIREQTGRPDWSPQEIAEAAHQGDERVLGIVTDAAEQLATLLAGFCVLFNPDRLVLGGGVVRAYSNLYLKPFQASLNKAIGGWTAPEVRQAALQERVGVLGALLVAQRSIT